MPKIIGYIRLGYNDPCFVLPILKDKERNLLLVQKSSNENFVEDYEPFFIDNYACHNYEHLKQEVGDKYLWGFRLSDAEVLISSREKLVDWMKTVIESNLFEQNPMTLLEVAAFCGVDKMYEQSLGKVYRLLKEQDRKAALIWRDSNVLLPICREELSHYLDRRKRESKNYLSQVYVVGKSRSAKIFAPKVFGGLGWKNKIPELLPKLRKMADLFDIRDIEFEIIDPGIKYLKEPNLYGVVVTFDGLGGDLVNFYHEIPQVWPNTSLLSRAKKSVDYKPAFNFYLFRDHPKIYSEVLAAVRRRKDDEIIDVAVIAAPASYGTDYKKPYDASELDDLRDHFDYVIYIGSHLLKKPNEMFLSLGASRSSKSFARSAIEAFVDLANTTSSKFSKKDFLQKFPQAGYVIFGRSNVNKKQPSKEFPDLWYSMNSLIFSWQHSRRIYVLSGAPIRPEVRPTYLKRKIPPLSEVPTIRGRYIRSLAFGVRRHSDRSDVRFYKFIADLLSAKCFSTTSLDSSQNILKASFGKTNLSVVCCYEKINTRQSYIYNNLKIVSKLIFVYRFLPLERDTIFLRKLQASSVHYSKLYDLLDGIVGERV